LLTTDSAQVACAVLNPFVFGRVKI
jgi:hypothetical protein